MTLTLDFQGQIERHGSWSFLTMTLILTSWWWPRWGVRIYRIMTGVTSDIGGDSSSFDYPIMSQFCTCHNSSAAMACAPLWNDLINIFFRPRQHVFLENIFWLWAYKVFVKWVPEHLLLQDGIINFPGTLLTQVWAASVVTGLTAAGHMYFINIKYNHVTF